MNEVCDPYHGPLPLQLQLLLRPLSLEVYLVYHRVLYWHESLRPIRSLKRPGLEIDQVMRYRSFIYFLCCPALNRTDNDKNTIELF